MTIPAWILDVFAAVMLAVAAASAARLAARRPWQRGRGAAIADIDVGHLLMGIAMAGTLTTSLHTLPDGAWAAVFGVLTAWFGYQVARDARVEGVRALSGAQCGPHLVHSAAMLSMFTAVAASAAASRSGMSSMGGSAMPTLDLPVLAFIFAFLLIGYCVWDLDQLSGSGVTGHYSIAPASIRPVEPALAGVPAVARTGLQAASAGTAGPEGGAATSSGSQAAATPAPMASRAVSRVRRPSSPPARRAATSSARISASLATSLVPRAKSGTTGGDSRQRAGDREQQVMPSGQVRAFVRQHGRELVRLEDSERAGSEHDGGRAAGHAVHGGLGGVQQERRVRARDPVAGDAGGLSVRPRLEGSASDRRAGRWPFIEARPSQWPGRCRWRVVVSERTPLRDAAMAFDQRLRAGLSESETGQLEALLTRLRDNVS